jgi:hypothetical protein
LLVSGWLVCIGELDGHNLCTLGILWQQLGVGGGFGGGGSSCLQKCWYLLYKVTKQQQPNTFLCALRWDDLAAKQ